MYTLGPSIFHPCTHSGWNHVWYPGTLRRECKGHSWLREWIHFEHTSMQMLLKGSAEACVTDPRPNQGAPSVHSGTSWKISAGFYFPKCLMNESGRSYRIGGRGRFWALARRARFVFILSVLGLGVLGPFVLLAMKWGKQPFPQGPGSLDSIIQLQAGKCLTCFPEKKKKVMCRNKSINLL